MTKVIKAEKVVSSAGAGVKITAVVLTSLGKESLTTGGVKLPKSETASSVTKPKKG